MIDFLKEFDSYFSGNIADYALVKHDVGYSILNVKDETSLLIGDVQMGNFFVDRLIELGVHVYASINDIPGWGTVKREPPPEMHPTLKKIIESMEKKKRQ